jgi:type IV fimbrial biogenesis protein FimT
MERNPAMSKNNRPPRPGFRASSGFTLLELLITLSIAAVLLAAAAPSFTNMVAKQNVDSTSDTLMRALYLARTESIKRGSRVVTCLSDSVANCTPTNPESVLIFSDSDKTGSPTDASDLIKTIQLDTASTKVTYNRPFLAYNAMGLASGTNGTFTVCGGSGKGALVIVSSLGRARKGRDYDGDGVVEKVPGSPISC